ncbi:MAG: hypothetical protein JO340_16870 [Acidobacteriaceae bacterium]|nr:hypothetical protein [Acidobacteriaceae bacterium]
MPTPTQIAANRKNAQLSTGPTSPEGKATSSLNAVKTGLTGRTVLLPGDDASLYEAHVAAFFSRHQPAGDEECNLVQSLADTEWRLLRIPALEFGIYAVGRLEFANEFPAEQPDSRKHLIEAKIFLAYQRQLNNLSIQECRLRRQREKDAAALRQLQENRRRRHERAERLRFSASAPVVRDPRESRLDEAARQYIAAVHQERHMEWEPDENGFEFSMTEVEVRAIELEPDLFASWAEENEAQDPRNAA